jgi:hypothetical protein
MVIVYLPNGQSVQLPKAVKGDLEQLPGTGRGYNGFIFRSAEGQVVGVFRLDQIAGWAIEPG